MIGWSRQVTGRFFSDTVEDEATIVPSDVVDGDAPRDNVANDCGESVDDEKEDKRDGGDPRDALDEFVGTGPATLSTSAEVAVSILSFPAQISLFFLDIVIVG